MTLVVRPETLARSREGEGAGGVVEDTSFAGAYRRYVVRVADVRLTWHAPPHERLARGDAVTLTLPTECWTLPET